MFGSWQSHALPLPLIFLRLVHLQQLQLGLGLALSIQVRVSHTKKHESIDGTYVRLLSTVRRGNNNTSNKLVGCHDQLLSVRCIETALNDIPAVCIGTYRLAYKKNIRPVEPRFLLQASYYRSSRGGVKVNISSRTQQIAG